MNYDNRNLMRGGKLVLSRRNGPLHFSLQVGEKRIIYCYIRKNACTAFKRLFLEHSPAEPKPARGENPIEFMIRHHRASFPWDYWAADHVVFVYRDPVERVVSVFRNKFIEEKEHGDISESFERLTGADPRKCTFRMFVDTYLQHEWRDLDPHLRPQYRHLLPVRYTDAIPISCLHGDMVRIVGKDVADRIFKVRTNASQGGSEREQPGGPVYDIPAEELARGLREGEMMLSTPQFLDDAIVRKLSAMYREDIALVASLTARGAKG